MVVNLSAATLGAPQSALDNDMAAASVSCTIRLTRSWARRSMPVSAARLVVRSVSAARRAHAWSLQPRPRARGRSQEARATAAAATGEDEPELAQIRRVRADLVLVAALIVSAYFLIAQLANIGFGTIAHQAEQRRPGLAGRRADPRSNHIRHIGHRHARRGGNAAGTAAERSAASGNQVRQPHGPQLGWTVG